MQAQFQSISTRREARTEGALLHLPSRLQARCPYSQQSLGLQPMSADFGVPAAAAAARLQARLELCIDVHLEGVKQLGLDLPKRGRQIDLVTWHRDVWFQSVVAIDALSHLKINNRNILNSPHPSRKLATSASSPHPSQLHRRSVHHECRRRANTV